MEKQTPARMARLVAQWRKSGQSQAGFARRHRIPGWTFWYWCQKLSDAPPIDDAKTAAPPAFVPVHMAGDPHAPVIDIVLSGGERVHIAAGASPDLVQTVVTTLRSRC
jgi:hypothetical protein